MRLRPNLHAVSTISQLVWRIIMYAGLKWSIIAFVLQRGSSAERAGNRAAMTRKKSYS
jgi:hypothetical protein